jgi:hypothetical protein
VVGSTAFGAGVRSVVAAFLLSTPAHAAGWIVGGYIVPDSTRCYVYGVLCSGGTCSVKSLWDADGGYGVAITEGAPGDTVRFRLSLSSGSPQNVVLYVIRENVANRKLSPEVAPVRIQTQAPPGLMAWARQDTALVAWAQPVAGTSPLAATYAYSFTPWETESIVLTTQNAVQHALWNQRREHIRRIIEVAGWPGWWLDGGYVP